MFWEVGLLVTTLAAAISASIGDEPPQGGSGIDATGTIINKSNPFRGLDANGVIINETELLTISDEVIDFYNENSIEERKGCSPTTSCTRAGGYCIKGRARCTGTVDQDGCKGGKKCKCCIPDQTTQAPLTCPAATPCPTVTSPTTTPCPTCPTTTPCPTCPATTPCPTAAMPTTEGTTVNPNLSWLNVGSDRFVRFPQTMSWFDARSLCKVNGLDLLEPKNITGVAIYLADNFSDKWYWVGARGNGVSQIWLSGGAIPRSAPWYSTYYTGVGTDKCAYIITWSGEPRKGTTLATFACTESTYMVVLCG